MKKATENTIDLERVINDPDYRRTVIKYLNGDSNVPSAEPSVEREAAGSLSLARKIISGKLSG